MAAKTLPDVGLLRQLLDYDPETGCFTWKPRDASIVRAARESTRVRIARNWNARFAGKPAFVDISKRGYFVASIMRKRQYAHRVAWAMHFGDWPEGEIDHIDGDPLNNRIANLREVSHKNQMKNLARQRRNKTGVLGVWYNEGRGAFEAYVNHGGKRLHLGRFATLEDAAQARADADARFGYHPNHGRDTRRAPN